MKAANAKSNKIHHDRVFPAVNAIFLILLMFVTLYPVLNTVAYSFNDGTDALRGNIGLWPRVFSLESYKSILSDKAVYQAAWISGSKTVLITLSDPELPADFKDPASEQQIPGLYHPDHVLLL